MRVRRWMILSRPIAIGGGVAALGLAVAWMVPPTTPIARQIAPTVPHVAKAAPQAYTAAPPAYAFYDTSPPVDQSADTDVKAAMRSRWQADDGQDRGAPAPPPEQDRGFARYPYADPQAEFDRGYRWAARRQAEDPRECRRWTDTPVEDGCLAYLRDAAERGDADESDDR
jgi:hypothetical protein